MGIISNINTRFKSNHPAAYSMISDYKVDLKNNIIKVNVITFASLEARIEEGDPIDRVTYGFEGGEYTDINTTLCEGEISTNIKLEDNHKSNIYDKIMKKDKFKNSLSVTEKMLIDKNGRETGEEISLKEAISTDLLLEEDFTIEEG